MEVKFTKQEENEIGFAALGAIRDGGSDLLAVAKKGVELFLRRAKGRVTQDMIRVKSALYPTCSPPCTRFNCRGCPRHYALQRLEILAMLGEGLLEDRGLTMEQVLELKAKVEEGLSVAHHGAALATSRTLEEKANRADSAFHELMRYIGTKNPKSNT